MKTMKNLIILFCWAFLLFTFGQTAISQTQSNDLGIEFHLWYGNQKGAKVLSMEEEAIFKGGTGKGAWFNYTDVGAHAITAAPLLKLTYDRDAYRLSAEYLSASAEGRRTLPGVLEYDGEIFPAGTSVKSEFNTMIGSIKYSHRLSDTTPPLYGSLQVLFFNWEGVIRSSANRADELIHGFSLPIVGISGEKMVGPDTFIGYQAAGTFMPSSRRGVALDKNSNSVYDIALTLGYEPSSEVNLSIGYRAFGLNIVSLEHDDEANSLNYRIHGPAMALSVSF